MSRKSLKNQLQTHHISTVSVLHLSLCLTVTGLWSKLQLVWLKSRVHCCLCLSVFSLIFLRDKTAWLLTPASSTEETHSGVQPLMDACRETFLRFIRFSQIYHRKKTSKSRRGDKWTDIFSQITLQIITQYDVIYFSNSNHLSTYQSFSLHTRARLQTSKPKQLLDVIITKKKIENFTSL